MRLVLQPCASSTASRGHASPSPSRRPTTRSVRLPRWSCPRSPVRYGSVKLGGPPILGL